MTERLFLAINLDNNVKEKIRKISVDLKANESSSIKWENIEKIHITLLFLGNVKIDQKKNLIKELENYERPKFFDFIINNLGFFPNDKYPRVIWLGIEKSEELKQLSKDISTICKNINIDFDKKEFKPHLTLGRIKNNVSTDFINYAKNYKYEKMIQTVKSFELMKSILEPSGSKYFIEAKINLMEK